MTPLQVKIINSYRNDLQPPSYQYIANKVKCSKKHVFETIRDWKLASTAGKAQARPSDNEQEAKRG